MFKSSALFTRAWATKLKSKVYTLDCWITIVSINILPNLILNWVDSIPQKTIWELKKFKLQSKWYARSSSYVEFSHKSLYNIIYNY